MPCDCRLEGKEGMQNRVLLALLAINAVMFCAEVVAGILASSSALLADSLDMLADATIKILTIVFGSETGERIRENGVRLGFFAKGAPAVGFDSKRPSQNWEEF